MSSTSFRALVVEDDASWQQILGEILSDMGLEVDITPSLETALSEIKAQTHRLGVVDLSLKAEDHQNTDGLQILAALRSADPDCQSILLTGFATVELAVSVLTEFGAFTFLRKESFQRAHFREVVNRALASPLRSKTSRDNQADIELAPKLAIKSTSPINDNKVLVVEDDAGWRGIFSELLVDAGYEVRLCASFGDALGSLRREKFVLAVIDLSLSQIPITREDSPAIPQGFHLLEEAKNAGLPAIVVSGIGAVNEIKAAYSEYSIFAYMEKQTFDRAAFQRLVMEASRSSTALSELAGLTGREREVLALMAKGLTNKEIAGSLVITENTVKRHLKSIFDKLDVHTRAAAVSKLAVHFPQKTIG